jgi:uncharacterized protein YbjT (DUF2867 family)
MPIWGPDPTPIDTVCCVGRDANPTAAIIDSQSAKTTEAAGPRVYSYAELLRTTAREAGLRPVLTPFALWYALAGLAEILPHPPLTRNQVELMQVDTAVSDRPGFRELGIRRDRSKRSSWTMLKNSA